jgi:group I intron endonuclease
MHYIYIIKNIINGKMYVGQTINLIARWSCHKYNSNTYNYPIYLAMRKYGIENFQFIPVENFNTQPEADIAEKFWIDLLETKYRKFGYNIKDGGSHGKHSEESKSKMSLIKIGKKASENTKLKFSKLRSGNLNPNFGKTTSKEVRAKISKSVTLKVQGEDNPNAKLTKHLVNLIKIDYESGEYTHRSLGKKYSVSYRTIGLIITGKIWKE